MKRYVVVATMLGDSGTRFVIPGVRGMTGLMHLRATALAEIQIGMGRLPREEQERRDHPKDPGMATGETHGRSSSPG